MTYDEIVAEIPKLSAAERERLFVVVVRSLRTDGVREAGGRRNPAAILKWAGALKTDGPPPTDEELKEDYIDYLEKKYS